MESITIFKNYLLIALRLTFGGAPGPALWGVISETATDISNTLLQNDLLDAQNFMTKLLIVWKVNNPSHQTYLLPQQEK
jgi:hypothetical protein